MSFNKKKSKVLEDNDDDDSFNETFVIYGTELPDTNEQDKGKFQPVWKQEVRDEQGLRRFHGAFKGGWSAGYFNTVGSKEGWTPSTFVSSRQNRSDHKNFKPEDFMDEEDLEELLQDQKLVTTEEFDSLGSTERELEKKRMLASSMEESGSVFGALPDEFIDDLVLPNKDPVGVRLLKAMGWREGQGIGPRVSKVQNEDTELLEDEKSFLFAPKDTEIIKFEQKSDTYGLDFEPFKNATEFINNNKGDSYFQHKKFQDSLSARGTIGFGVLNDDDDDAFYSENSTSNFHSSLIDDDDDTIIMGGKKLSRYLPPKKYMEKKVTFIPLAWLSNGGILHDGNLSLRGFVLASRPVPIDKWFAPPVLPQGFAPIHEFNSSEEMKKMDTQILFQRGKQQKQTTLPILAEQRGELLGETPLKAPTRSVFDYVSRKDKDRLDSLIGYIIDTTGETEKKQPSEVEIPKVDRNVALAALQGFIPFESDKKKQARYKHYLEMQAELNAVPLKKPENFTTEEYIKELDEFAQSARIFRPMSKMMASRFTSAKSEDLKQSENDIQFASEQISQIHQDDNNIRQTHLESPASSAETAARMNMFGPLTRTRSNFYPSRLLCKRFNVANPHPDYKYDNQFGKTQKGQKDVLSKETMDDILRKQDSQKFMGSTDSKNHADIEMGKATSPDTSKQTDIDKEVDVKTRPAMELFKSIFGESDTEDEDAAPKHKEPPNMVIGTVNDTKLVEDKKSPIRSEPSEEAVNTLFRPMFKKKSDRTEKAPTSESTEISQLQTAHSKRKEKGLVNRVSLSFEDESIGPSIKRVKSNEIDSSSSAESSDSLSHRGHKHAHRRHKNSHDLSKKHKQEKKKKKKKRSKKKANKRSCEESEDDERYRNSKKKKHHEDESEYHRSNKYHRNKDSRYHQITKSVDKTKEPVDDKKFEDRPGRLIETSIPKKCEESPSSSIQSKEKRTATSSQSKNDSNKSNIGKSRNRPRAMDLW